LPALMSDLHPVSLSRGTTNTSEGYGWIVSIEAASASAGDPPAVVQVLNGWLASKQSASADEPPTVTQLLGGWLASKQQQQTQDLIIDLHPRR
jgi:hypothetical protein